MKKASVFLAAITALTMVGCTEVPEDVISRTEEQQARESAAAEDSKVYAESDFDPYAKVSLSEVKAELNGYKFKAHDNLEFKCEPCPIEADEVYNITMTAGFNDIAVEEDKQKLKDVLQDVCELTIGDEQLFIEGNEVSAKYGEEDPKGYMYHGSTSFSLCDYSLVPRFDVSYSYYRLNEYPKEKLQMVDGSTLSVDEAIEQADEYIKKLRNNSMFDTLEEQKLFRVAIGKFNDKNVIRLRYQQVRSGLPIDEGGFCGSWNTRSPAFYISFIGSRKTQEIVNFWSSIEQSKETVSEIIPLSSAEYLASNGLAKKMNFEVSETELRYVCFTDPKKQADPLMFKPMWVFNICEWKNKAANGQEFMRMQLYVDAVTGELYYSDPSKGQFFSSAELKYADF